MINTNKAFLALTSLSEQAMHAHIAIRLSRENDQIFSVIPVINSAINSAIMGRSNFVDSGIKVAFFLYSCADGGLIADYLNNLKGVTDVTIQANQYLCINVISFKIIATQESQ